MQTRTLTLLAALSLMLGACAGTKLFTPASLTVEKEGQDNSLRDIEFSGPATMISRRRIEPINLLFMLDPAGRAKVLYGRAKSIAGATLDERWIDLSIDERYEWGFHAFYEVANDRLGTQEERRNRIQDRLLISSDQRCGLYRRVLYEVQADQQFWTGSLATVTGVLGALVSGASASRSWSAASGIFSGVGAEFSQAYYANLAANVITKGIEERRKAIFERIREAQKAGIRDYTVQAAVKDAVFYDVQCSIVSGLEEAQDAIRLAADPGMDAANRIIAKQKITADLFKVEGADKLKELSDKYSTLQSSSLLGGDRFSNVGVRALTTTANSLNIRADGFGPLKLDVAAESALLAAGLKTLVGAKTDAKRLKLDDGAQPPKAIGALHDLADLAAKFNATTDKCSTDLLGDLGTKIADAAKETDATAKEEKLIAARAAMQRMDLIRDSLALLRARIEGLRRDYLAQAIGDLLAGDVSATDGTDLKPMALAKLSTTAGKKINSDAIDIAASIGKRCQ